MSQEVLYSASLHQFSSGVGFTSGRIDVMKHCRVLPRSYCEVQNEPNPSHTTVSRTHERISLGSTGNLQGSVKFYCLNTGRVLKRRDFTEILMPTAVIAKVNKIGKK